MLANETRDFANERKLAAKVPANVWTNMRDTIVREQLGKQGTGDLRFVPSASGGGSVSSAANKSPNLCMALHTWVRIDSTWQTFGMVSTSEDCQGTPLQRHAPCKGQPHSPHQTALRAAVAASEMRVHDATATWK